MFFYFTPPLEEEVDSTALAVEDGGVLFFAVYLLFEDVFFELPSP